MNNDLTFVFKGYDFSPGKGEVVFYFGFRGEKNIDFREKLKFPPVDTSKIPQNLIRNILDGLLLILGISYWKLYCPKDIVVKPFSLTREQAEFWNTVYTKGMGEFYYKNRIDFRGLVHFPSAKQNSEKEAINFPRQNRYLVGIGGGKDSIASAELLRRKNKQLDLVTSGFPIQIEIAKMIGGRVINTFRQVDPKLLELNKEGDVYNGHIPISAYYAFLLLFLAALFDYGEIVVGNEKSADFGNVEYLGLMINHQWSKSEEFENLFDKYVKKFITPDIAYSSPLREMSELQVVGEFVKYPRYFKVFSSCNRNYKIALLRQVPSGTWLRRSKWCGKCAKCLFVFICLSAFLAKEKVLAIFGKNLFEDKSLIPLFEELIGVRNFKPFECVGTPKEVREALEKISEKGEFDKTVLMKHFKNL